MPAGIKEIKYTVTLCKREGDNPPVITPYNIGKKQYEKVLLIILKAQGRVDWQAGRK